MGGICSLLCLVISFHINYSLGIVEDGDLGHRRLVVLPQTEKWLLLTDRSLTFSVCSVCACMRAPARVCVCVWVCVAFVCVCVSLYGVCVAFVCVCMVIGMCVCGVCVVCVCVYHCMVCVWHLCVCVW